MSYGTSVVPWRAGTEVPGRRVAQQILAETRLVVEPAHRAAVNTLTPQIRHVAGFHAGWWDADGRPSGITGKAIRPAFVLACGRAAGARSDAAVAAAVAVELTHDFSLLHDDVMDGDQTRRHRPAAWAQFGVSQAILTGDALLVLAIAVLCDGLQGAVTPAGTGSGAASAEAVKVLAEALAEMCHGQLADLLFEQRLRVNLPECLAMAESKTGALLGAACHLGALSGRAGARDAASYRVFGRRAGLAFQLIDDLLGIWGDPQITGKPAGSDLLAGKKSLPVVAALTSGTPASRELAGLYQRHGDLGPAEVSRLAALIEAAGGRDWARDEADRCIAAAFRAIEPACPDPAALADLHALTGHIMRRDH